MKIKTHAFFLRIVNNFKLLSVFALIICSNSAYASSDFQIWIEGGLQYKINKKFRLDFDQYIRLDDSSSHLESISPELGIRFLPYRFLRFKAGYRFSAKFEKINSQNDYSAWNRIFFDALLRHNFDFFRPRYRLRFQEVFGKPYTDEGIVTKHTIRNKFQFGFNVGKGFEPFIAGELYIRINDNDGLLHKWRTTAGLEYKYSKHLFLLYYREEEMLNGANLNHIHIIGLGYHYIF